MAEVKWVKITTDMFDNRKIKHLRKLPDGNNIVLIWVMLLTMAGRCNAGGMIFLTENIPYTPKMLADELGFEENTVKLALQALEQFNMVVTDQGYFSIAGWQEYQNTDGLEKIREQNRLRKAKQRAKQKELPPPSRDSHGTVTQCHATEEDIDIDKEGEEEKEDIGNSVPESPSPAPKKTRKRKKADKDEEPKQKYGEFQNVLLTDRELEKLKDAYPDWEDRIERLSCYIEQFGKKYTSHYATILSWARRDEKDKLKTIPRQDAQPYRKQTKADELNEFYEMAARWAAEGE